RVRGGPLAATRVHDLAQGSQVSSARMVNLTAALAPVLCLLGLLILMDSFKLVSVRFVLQALAAGAAAAVAAMFINVGLIHELAVPRPLVTRVIAPITEELLKLAFVVYALRSRRVGFPVDAAILG